MTEEESSRKEVTLRKDDDTVTVYKESHVDRKDHAELHVMTSEEEDLTVKARRAGSALEDLITSAIDRAKEIAREKAKEAAKAADLGPGVVSAAQDSRDISRLGPLVVNLARTFEDTMTEIRKHNYDEQVNLLIGYRKLLEEQVNVIDSRKHYVKRLKK
jgi:hypothetical protein